MSGPRGSAGQLAVAVLALLGLLGCGDPEKGVNETEQVDPATGCRMVEQPVPRKVNLDPPKAKSPSASGVQMQTSCGPIEIRFDPRAPKTTASFEYLVKRRVFNSTDFHAIAPSIGVIQGGDPEGDGYGGPGYRIDEPPPPDAAYTRGVVAMAKSEAEPPGRSGSQFFIVSSADAGLSPDYALVGRVTRGIGAVERIAALAGEDGDGPPTIPVVIERAQLIRRFGE